MNKKHAIYLVISMVLLCAVNGRAGAQAQNVLSCDVCVVGGGSGGFGAALAAARAGAEVILVEKEAWLGGTSTSAYVTNWEPGPGCAFALELYERLRNEPGAVAVVPRTHSYQRDEPYGMAVGNGQHDQTYEASLRRAGVPHEKQCSVVMKPEALAKVMETMLLEAGVTILLNTTFNDAVLEDEVVRQIACTSKDGQQLIIRASVFVDSTGGAVLCRKSGCETMLGAEPRSRLQEPSAPEEARRFLNGISLCYHIRKSAAPVAPPKPSANSEGFGKSAFVYGVDAEELLVNPLPIGAGILLLDNGYEKTMEIAKERVLGHWSWLHAYPHFQAYELVSEAPMLGIRESYRVVTDYILTESDIRAGLSRQTHQDMIAIADHPLDIHGGGPALKEGKEPYGIPYRCLLPKGKKNLLVACRGAGFSHIAASSCRLSRTMMALGHAAGLAAADAVAKDGNVRAIDTVALVQEMGIVDSK